MDLTSQSHSTTDNTTDNTSDNTSVNTNDNTSVNTSVNITDNTNATTVNIPIFNGYINYKYFLYRIYNIKNLYDGFDYINKNELFSIEIKRILTMCWQSFIYDIDNIPNIVYEYYINKYNTKWKNKYIDKISKIHERSVVETNINNINIRKLFTDIFKILLQQKVFKTNDISKHIKQILYLKINKYYI